MSNKKLRRTGLSQELCDRLGRHHITTCRDMLCVSLLELMKVTGLSPQNVGKLIITVSKACAPKMRTAYEMNTTRASNPYSAFLSTNLDLLDKVLRGGVTCGTLTELTGPSGCGKTQFCIMMSIIATLPTSMGGLDGAVIYVDTESAFSAERLVEMAGNRFPVLYDTEEKLFSLSRRIHLYRELTCEDLLKRIESLEEEIISKKVKLIIIDSVASVVRKEFDTNLQGNLNERSNFLNKEASALKYLAEEFSIPVSLALSRYSLFIGTKATIRGGNEKPMRVAESSFDSTIAVLELSLLYLLWRNRVPDSCCLERVSCSVVVNMQMQELRSAVMYPSEQLEDEVLVAKRESASA
ncbi:DNA repair protein RAD51 homolog 2 [Pleurodeles waltl]|uniref:DNA repair protein RAD51 homolog 2 n=1 Tax=Pleurodeles waltl TaxID=8319 RepID=UPI003709B97A